MTRSSRCTAMTVIIRFRTQGEEQKQLLGTTNQEIIAKCTKPPFVAAKIYKNVLIKWISQQH